VLLRMHGSNWSLYSIASVSVKCVSWLSDYLGLTVFLLVDNQWYTGVSVMVAVRATSNVGGGGGGG